MEQNTSRPDTHPPGRQGRKPAAGTAPRNDVGGDHKRPRKTVFDKEYATLWLLTLTLGLGLGAVLRIVQRSEHASATAATSHLASQRSATPAFGTTGGFQNQRVLVLPQQSFGARGMTRMS